MLFIIFVTVKHFVTLRLKSSTWKKFYLLILNFNLKLNCLTLNLAHIVSTINLFRETPRAPRYPYKKISFPGFSSNSRDKKPYHITEKDLFSTWQHNPAFSSSVMTHISLSVSRRGGVQNDTLAWKILFEGTCWGLTEQPDWGEMSWYCHSAKSFFVSTVGCGTVGLYSLFLSLSGSVPSPLASQFVQLSVAMSQSILKSVLCPHKPCWL